MVVAAIDHFLVVWTDNIFHISCGTVAYLYIIPVGTCSKGVERANLTSEKSSLQDL